MYRVELQQFEGPMDLLLFFIKRDEIDITDIPIAKIADEYLAYVRVMEEIDLDGVADFIYMAALLINIKARMLLPSEQEGDDGEAVDPRRELVERLLEYVRFKEAADQLSMRREMRQEHFTRGDAEDEREDIQDEHEADIDATVYDLVQALGKMLEEADDEDEVVRHEVEPLKYTMEEQQRYVIDRLRSASRLPFRTLIQQRSKAFIIATFLAVLELARQHYLRIEIMDSRVDFAVSGRDDQPMMEDDPGVVDAAQTTADPSSDAGPSGEADPSN